MHRVLILTIVAFYNCCIDQQCCIVRPGLGVAASKSHSCMGLYLSLLHVMYSQSCIVYTIRILVAQLPYAVAWFSTQVAHGPHRCIGLLREGVAVRASLVADCIARHRCIVFSAQTQFILGCIASNCFIRLVQACYNVPWDRGSCIVLRWKLLWKKVALWTPTMYRCIVNMKHQCYRSTRMLHKPTLPHCNFSSSVALWNLRTVAILFEEHTSL